MSAESDAIIRVRFLTTAEGGKTRNITDAAFYRPHFHIDGEYHAGSFMEQGLVMELGAEYETTVSFVRPDLVLPKLCEAKAFTICEGTQLVAHATVVRLFGATPPY